MTPPDDSDIAEIYVEVSQREFLDLHWNTDLSDNKLTVNTTLQSIAGKEKDGRWICAVVQKRKRWAESSSRGRIDCGRGADWVIRRILCQDEIKSTDVVAGGKGKSDLGPGILLAIREGVSEKRYN